VIATQSGSDLGTIDISVRGTAGGLTVSTTFTVNVSPLTGVQNTVSFTGTTLNLSVKQTQSKDPGCFPLFSTCFSIQQNFWVNDGTGTSDSDYWWVQNIMLIYNYLGVWSESSSYNVFNGSNMSTPEFGCGLVSSGPNVCGVSILPTLLGAPPFSNLQLTSELTNGNIRLAEMWNGITLNTFTVGSPLGGALTLPSSDKSAGRLHSKPPRTDHRW
jgi:hypothetical protein